MAPPANESRTILGPLTTTFSAAASCHVPVAQCTTCTNAWLAQSCDSTISGTSTAYGVHDNPDCWPARSGTATSSPAASLFGWGFYSPGLLCPTGYSSACSATAGGISDWLVQFTMMPSETAVGCCPTGYGCTNFNGQTCVLAATNGYFPLASCSSGTTAGTVIEVIPATIKAASTNTLIIKTYSIFAPMFQINWQATDLIASSTSMSSSSTSKVSADSASTSASNTITTGPSTQTTSNTAASASSSATSKSSSGLSTGASIGIGVGVGLAVVAALIVSLFFCLRAKKRKAAQMPQEMPIEEFETPKPHEYHQVADKHHPVAEMPGQGMDAELFVPRSDHVAELQ